MKNYELERIEKETIFNDLIKVMEFLSKYLMDEELDEIYRIDSKYDRAKNLSIIKWYFHLIQFACFNLIIMGISYANIN